MEMRRVVTTHSGLATLARERIVVGRLASLTDAVREHERRTASVQAARLSHDQALYDQLRAVDDEQAA